MSARMLAMLAAMGSASLGTPRAPAPDVVVARTFHAGGIPATERRYVGGVEDGRHRGWWPNGRPRFDYTYAHGLMTGRALEWFPSGRPYRDFHYAAGHESGRQRMWFADGTLRANYEVRDGRRYGLMGSKGCVTPEDAP